MRSFAIPALLFLAASPAASFGAQTEPDTEIVVTGQRAAEARKQAQAYIRELGVASRDRSVARWVDPICPVAKGISTEHASLVEQQIRQTAKAVGARVAGESCVANFVVIFTEDASSLIGLIAKREPGRIARPGATTPISKLEQAKAPILWWYNTDVRAKGGLSEGKDPGPSVKFSDYSGNDTGAPSGSATTTTHYGASLVSTQIVRAINAATIVVDVNRADGNRLRSITDYAALVGLAEIDFSSTPKGSILSLFQGGESHQALSQRDRDFLSGLYRIPLDRKVVTQRNRLLSEMTRKAGASTP